MSTLRLSGSSAPISIAAGFRTGNLRRERAAHAEDRIGTFERLLPAANHGAGFNIARIGDSSARPGTGLDRHDGAERYEFLDGFGGRRDARLDRIGFLQDRDLQAGNPRVT